jgi:putative transposase
MPRTYSSSVRRQIFARLRSGKPVAVVAAETGICQATLFAGNVRRSSMPELSRAPECRSADELAATHKRIAQLEAELA